MLIDSQQDCTKSDKVANLCMTVMLSCVWLVVVGDTVLFFTEYGREFYTSIREPNVTHIIYTMYLLT